MDKLVSIQWLRGAAAVAVVWFHAMFLVSNNGLQAYQVEYGDIRQIGAVGVDVFFVISGFIVSISATRARSVRAFIGNRFWRIWPLYAIATLLYLLVRPDRLDPGALALSLLFVQPLGSATTVPTLPPGWTLLFEAAFYAVIALALCWRSARPLHERIAIAIVLLVLLGSAYGFSRPLNIVGNPIMLEFLLGVLIGRVWASGYRLPAWLATAMFAAGTFFILRDAMHGMYWDWKAESTLDASLSWQRFRTWGLYAGLIVCSAALRAPVPQGTGKLMTLLGDASYSIYLFHMHVLDLLVHRLDLFGTLSPDAIILAATACATLVGVLVHRVLERPLMRLAKHWRARAPNPAG